MYKVYDFCILSGSRGRRDGGGVIFLLYIRVNMKKKTKKKTE